MSGWSMESPAVEQAIRAIHEDRMSGASTLARRALDAMAIAMEEADGLPDPARLAEVARRLSETQPAMAIVHNVVHLVVRLLTEGHEAATILAQVRAELDRAGEGIARTFLKVAPPNATIVTLSYSENVLAAIEAAHRRSPVAGVLVLESAPGLEGHRFSEALRGRGIPASVVSDAAGPESMRGATCALVGADSVLRDASVVNKVGTRALAQAAADHRKPFYVACETLKFDARYDASTWPRPPAEAPFDLTPGEWVTGAATERGYFTPEVIRTMMAPGRDLGRARNSAKARMRKA